jgi:hypothetical protein
MHVRHQERRQLSRSGLALGAVLAAAIRSGYFDWVIGYFHIPPPTSVVVGDDSFQVIVGVVFDDVSIKVVVVAVCLVFGVAVIGVVFVFVNSGVVIPVVSPVVVFIVIIIDDGNIVGLRCRRSSLWRSRLVCRWFSRWCFRKRFRRRCHSS